MARAASGWIDEKSTTSLAGAGRLRDAVAAEHHRFDGGGVGDAHEDDAGGGRHVARTRGGLGASLDQRSRFGGGAIPNGDVMTRLDQPSRHRKSHHPKPEISELFRISLAEVSHSIPLCNRRPFSLLAYHSPVRVADERRGPGWLA